ncbi:MAG: hypothetical protein AAFV85_07200 [Cyanobacteria bacterium J06634_6]
MQIQLNDTDLKRMPTPLRVSLLSWLEDGSLSNMHSMNSKLSDQAKDVQCQLGLAVETSLASVPQARDSHVRLTQLFDAGITFPDMSVRIKLTKSLEEQLGYKYVTSGLAISSRGTVVYEGKEFDKPSPLAKTIVGSPVNGWDYVELQKNGRWICLSELRRIWRSAL